MKRHAEWTNDAEFFRRIAEDARILAWLTDAEGYATYLSPAWYAFTGTAAGSSEGFDWLNVVHAEDRVQTRKAFFAASDAGVEYGVSYRLRKRDGSYQLVWGHGVPRRTCEGTFAGYFGMTQTMEKYSNTVAELAKVQSAIGLKPLSARETEVMRLAAEGMTNEAIAKALVISCRTVEDHVKHSIEKLGATNRVHAVAKAVRLSVL